MFTSERKAGQRAMMGLLAHVFLLLILFLPFSSTHPDFGQPTQTSGWDMVMSFPPPGLLLASTFCPFLVYIGSLWLLSQHQKKWLLIPGSGAVLCILLTSFGWIFSLPALFFFVLTGKISFSGHIVSGPGFWLVPLAFFISFCCSFSLAISLFQIKQIRDTPLGDQ